MTSENGKIRNTNTSDREKLSRMAEKLGNTGLLIKSNLGGCGFALSVSSQQDDIIRCWHKVSQMFFLSDVTDCLRCSDSWGLEDSA